MKIKRFSAAVTAVLLLITASGCRKDNVDWEDTLPEAASTASVPTVSYVTEASTESSAPITLPEISSTSRTAFSETTPELATTTATRPEETTESTVSVVPDLPKVPISEFTSSTASEITTTSEADTSVSSVTAVISSSTSGETSESVLTQATTAAPKDPDKRYEISRPYAYNQLDEKYLYIYDALITGIEQLKTRVDFSSVMDITAEDYCAVYEEIYNNENAIFYIDTTMMYAVNSQTKAVASATVNYKYSEDKIRSMQSEINRQVDKILSEITPEMSDYEIVKHFYDYLALNVVYDEDAGNCRDIYGVFVEKKAICGGYAKAFSYLCDKVGIESLTITGDADGTPHMWNMVKLDGEWYHIDPTYAVTDAKTHKYVRYDYFCVNDETLSQCRTVYDQIYTYPKSTAEKYNYYVYNGLMADSWEDVETMMTNRIAEASKTKERVIQIRCSSKETYEDAKFKLFDRSEQRALNLLENAYDRAENKYRRDEVSYNTDDNSRVIKLILTYTS